MKASINVPKEHTYGLTANAVEADQLRRAIWQLGGVIKKETLEDSYLLTVEIPDGTGDLTPLYQTLCFKNCKHYEKARQQYGDGTAEMERALQHYCKGCALEGKA